MRGRQRAQVPGRGEQPHRADQRVEAPVAAGGLARRAGRGEAADRRVLEGLREVAEGEALGAERRLRLRPAQPGAEPRGERGVVDDDFAQRGQVEADQRRVGAAQGLDPADHAGAAAERHHGDVVRRAGVDQPTDGGRVGGDEDRVGSVLQPARAQPRQVDIAAADRVAQPVLLAVEDRVGADRVDHGARQRPRLGQVEIVDPRRQRPRFELADPFAQHPERGRVELGSPHRVPPAPPVRVAPRRGHRRTPWRLCRS